VHFLGVTVATNKALDGRNGAIPGRQVGMLRSLLLILLGATGFSSAAACTGGCWVTAGDVRTEPQTDCLTLYTGDSPTDRTVCAVPELGGMNNCAAALTLPKLSEGSTAVVVAPGGKISWRPPTKSVPPMIMVNRVGSNATEYVISATLGTGSVTITIPVHD
jgi:hypothetical protein